LIDILFSFCHQNDAIERVKIMAYKFLTTLLLFFSLSANANEFLLSLHGHQDFSSIKSEVAFYLFKDGVYSLVTNTGVGGPCSAKKVGSFKGQMKPEDVKEIEQWMRQGFKQCLNLESSSCTKNEVKDAKDLSWWLHDLSQKEKQTLYFRQDHKTPMILNDLIRKVEMMDPVPVESLALSRLKDQSFEFRYTGNNKISLTLSGKNFFIVDETGLTQPIDQVIKNFHLHQKTLQLANGEKKSIKLPIELPKSAKDWRLIYDSSSGDNPVGHPTTHFTPCFVF
jgi:hypothetical protein